MQSDPVVATRGFSDTSRGLHSPASAVGVLNTPTTRRANLQDHHRKPVRLGQAGSPGLSHGMRQQRPSTRLAIPPAVTMAKGEKVADHEERDENQVTVNHNSGGGIPRLGEHGTVGLGRSSVLLPSTPRIAQVAVATPLDRRRQASPSAYRGRQLHQQQQHQQQPVVTQMRNRRIGPAVVVAGAMVEARSAAKKGSVRRDAVSARRRAETAIAGGKSPPPPRLEKRGREPQREVGMPCCLCDELLARALGGYLRVCPEILQY